MQLVQPCNSSFETKLTDTDAFYLCQNYRFMNKLIAKNQQPKISLEELESQAIKLKLLKKL